MNRRTQEALAAVNRRFYSDHASVFDRTRAAPWRGWDRLLEAVAESWPRPPSMPTAVPRPLRLLDVGCGNGRFGALVQERWRGPWTYLGLDSSAELLAAAERRLAAVSVRELRPWDFLEEPLGATAPGANDLVVLFGLLHHVPGAALRRDLLRSAAALVAPGGYLAFTVWRFGDDPRFQKRTIPWDSAATGALEGVDMGELEAGDVLLRWGDQEGALRYCHAADDDEQEGWLEALAKESSLDLELRFDGDGKTAQLNRYFLLRRPLL